MTEKFHFTATDGTEIVAPYALDSIKRKELRKLQTKFKDDPAGLEDAMLKAALDAKTYDLVDNLSIRDYQAFAQGWGEEGAPNLGE